MFGHAYRRSACEVRTQVKKILGRIECRDLFADSMLSVTYSPVTVLDAQCSMHE